MDFLKVLVHHDGTRYKVVKPFLHKLYISAAM